MNLANPWVLPMLAMGLVLVATVVRTWRARSFVYEHALVAAAGAFYALPYAAELASTTLGAKLVWHRIAWFGIATMPVTSVLLAMRFIGRPLGKRATIAMSALALLFFLLSCTNELHHVLETPAVLASYGNFSMRKADGAPAFWLFVAFGYVAIFVNLLCYGAAWLTGTAVYQRQGRLLFFGTSLPVIGNFVYLFLGGTHIREFDPTPLLYGITCLVYAYTLKSGLLQIVPVARHAMVDAMRDPVFVLDLHRRVIDVNPAVRALLGHTAAHDPTLTLCRFLQNAPMLQALLEGDADGDLGDVEVAERTFAVRVAPLTFGGGRLVILRDVTERTRNERAQRLALEATARAKQARGDFIARMSHELRTPLHAVMGSSEMLLTTLSADDDRRRYAEASLVSARILLDLVDDVLDFERHERHLPGSSSEPFELLTMVHELAQTHTQVARRKGLTFVTTQPVEPAWVMGDVRRMRQILSNLLGNACKFTSKGSVSFAVTTSHGEEHTHVRVRIEDEGPGIPDVELERVFEPFVQLEEGTTRSYGGAGLGLAICRQLATSTGAELALRNREMPARGLIAEVGWTLATASAPVVGEADTETTSIEGLSVYVVDDNPISREVIGWLLSSLGVKGEVFATASDFLQAVTASAPAVALIDLHMPEGGGLEIAKRLRDRDVPLVAFTADGRESVRRECLAAGMVDLLQKPCSLQELHACLAEHGGVSAALSTAALSSEREREVRSLFLRTIPGEWARMAAALAAGDGNEVRRLAHELAGAAALTGVAEVVEACKEVLAAKDFSAETAENAPAQRLREVCLRLAAGERAEPLPS